MKFKIENSNMEIEYTKNLLNLIEHGDNKVYIIDSKVHILHKKVFNEIKDHSRIYIYKASEHTKNFDSLQRIYKFLQVNQVNRNSIIYGMGGGITTDITAFAASTYKRGCRLIIIPTTLLGMVDAAIGGKTGINFESIKNDIGSFYPAEKVIINTNFLKTQLEADYKDGIVEIIKMSFLPHSNLHNILSEKHKIEDVIKEAIRTKMEMCRHDLYDKSSRKLLNLGHTFGHVLESISNYEISHGTAVAIGIRAAARLSLQKGFIEKETQKAIEKRLDNFDLPTSFNSKYLHKIIKNGECILKQDKKADDKINLILFKGIRELFIYRTENSCEVINIFKEISNA